jgi:GNAT superfamily N-acetyltransferase
MKWTIRDFEEKDIDDVIRMARALPEWFTLTGLEHMKIDFHFQKGLVARTGEMIAGFLLYFSDKGILHISWIAVGKELHHKGVGRMLIERLEEMAKAFGIHEIRVETLGDSVEYEPYARTRAFYRAVGFSDFQRTMQDNPECPELLVLAKRL